MERTRNGFSLLDLLALIVIAVIAFFVFGPFYGHRANEGSRRKACNSNLGQLVKAMTTYQEPNGDYFPAQSQYTVGTEDVFAPMPSLALLYPDYVDNLNVFRCPSTKDRPTISITYIPADGNPKAFRHVNFGSVASDQKCSYFYDEFSDFRTIGPGQAMASDADGMTWLTPGPNGAPGAKPTYPATWTRKPRQPNHENGQNVMYFDGHVKWWETSYASLEPKDNIFCPNGGAAPGSGQWGADTDAYLWDGVNARAVQLDAQ